MYFLKLEIQLPDFYFQAVTMALHFHILPLSAVNIDLSVIPQLGLSPSLSEGWRCKVGLQGQSQCLHTCLYHSQAEHPPINPQSPLCRWDRDCRFRGFNQLLPSHGQKLALRVLSLKCFKFYL